jgi:hypothetical protein
MYTCQLFSVYRKYIHTYTACVGDMRNAYSILFGKPKRRDYLEDLGIAGRIILVWILGKWDGRVWTGCIWLIIVTSGRFL